MHGLSQALLERDDERCAHRFRLSLRVHGSGLERAWGASSQAGRRRCPADRASRGIRRCVGPADDRHPNLLLTGDLATFVTGTFSFKQLWTPSQKLATIRSIEYFLLVSSAVVRMEARRCESLRRSTTDSAYSS